MSNEHLKRGTIGHLQPLIYGGRVQSRTLTWWIVIDANIDQHSPTPPSYFSIGVKPQWVEDQSRQDQVLWGEAEEIWNPEREKMKRLKSGRTKKGLKWQTPDLRKWVPCALALSLSHRRWNLTIIRAFLCHILPPNQYLQKAFWPNIVISFGTGPPHIYKGFTKGKIQKIHYGP